MTTLDRLRTVSERLGVDPSRVTLEARLREDLDLDRVVGLAWRHLDLERGCIRLDRSKNGDGRTAYLPPDLLEAFRIHRAKVERLQVKLGRIVPDVFVRLKGKLAGQPLGSFRKRWAAACQAAGVPGLLVHDLRRSGIRTMVRAGISEHVAMAISGHTTRSVFDRYDITAEADLQAAASRLGTIPGTVARAAVESIPLTR